MNKINLLALDLDGTALKSNNTLSEAVKKAIENAYKSGIIIVRVPNKSFTHSA